MRDLEKMMEQLGPVIAKFVDDRLAAAHARIAELEKAAAAQGPEAYLTQVKGLVDSAVAENMPPAPNGPTAEEVAAIVSAGFERRFGDLTLSWERQARETFDKAVDRMPVPKDGADALPVEQIEITQDERTVTITLGQKSHTLTLDTILDRGPWREGRYQKGDAVSYGSNLWIAQDHNVTDVPGTSKAWRLAVRKGRDGRDLRDNASKHDASKGVPV